MDSPLQAVSCIILAGGEGRRVGGQDKGLVEHQGKPFIQHVLNAINHQVDDVVISANRNIAAYQRYSDKVIGDSASEYQGPLAGITACLPHCQHELVLVVACDMPALPGNLVQRLSETMHEHAVSLATVNNRHQLSLLVEKSQAKIIAQRLTHQQLKLIQWVESVSHTRVSFDDMPEAFVNLNTQK